MHAHLADSERGFRSRVAALSSPSAMVPCMCAGLAYYLSMKYAPQLMQGMKLVYEDEFQRALQEDGSASSTYITPKAYYPGS